MIKKLTPILLILFFTAQNILLAQSGAGTGKPISDNRVVNLQSNKQYFLVITKSGSLIGLSDKLKLAFKAPNFISVDIDEKQSILKIVSIKGTKIEDVKATLVTFNIGLIDYSEEYTNSTNPSIFNNH